MRATHLYTPSHTHARTHALETHHSNPPPGADWSASYEELALFKEGRARARFEGRPISDIFDVSCASAEWKAGGWEFSLGGVWGAPGGALEGRHFSLHFR